MCVRVFFVFVVLSCEMENALSYCSQNILFSRAEWSMKRRLARLLSNQFSQIDDFKQLCKLIRHTKDSQKIKSKIEQSKLPQIIGDCMKIEQGDIICAILSDPISQNQISSESIYELQLMYIDELQANQIHSS